MLLAIQYVVYDYLFIWGCTQISETTKIEPSLAVEKGYKWQFTACTSNQDSLHARCEKRGLFHSLCVTWRPLDISEESITLKLTVKHDIWQQ